MMTLQFRIGFIIVLLIGIGFIVNMIRKNRLELKYALVWLLLGSVLVVVLVIPDILDVMSKVLGVYSNVNMIFFLGFVFSIVIIFVLTVTLSRNSERTRKLAQVVALNEYQGNHLEKKK